MFFIIKSIILITIVLIVANDIMFNKRRNKLLKVLEFIICILLIVYIFINASNYISMKNNLENQIKNNQLFVSEVTVYNMDGTAYKMTIGDFLYNNFVTTVFENDIDTKNNEYIEGNNLILFVSGILFLYWIILLILFEKEEKVGYKLVEDEKIFEKYNPMIAACIAQNRGVMCRDIVGVILNLINKEKIKIRIVPDKSIKKLGYRYMISENLENKTRLDIIEKEIYDWIFEEIPKYNKGIINVDYISKNNEGIVEIDLIKRLHELSNNENTYARIKELNYTVKRRLNIMGANQESVPFLLKAFNNSIIIISILLSARHIISNGITMSITNIEILYFMFILIFVITILPIIYIASLVCFEFIRIYFKTLQQITEGYTGRRLIAKSISIIFATFLVMIIYATLANDFYIIFDILLIGVTCLVVFTDDYMLKHDYKILNDYYNLKRIEKRISDYSLMKDENIEYLKLWNEYYAYAVAFGIPVLVNEELDVSYQKTDILTKQNLEGIYYVSKAYLEVMWDMEFSDKKSKFDIFKILK